jgi:hypothetical protein
VQPRSLLDRRQKHLSGRRKDYVRPPQVNCYTMCSLSLKPCSSKKLAVNSTGDGSRSGEKNNIDRIVILDLAKPTLQERGQVEEQGHHLELLDR